MYEESLRMPFVVRYPREIAAGSASESICLNVDFAQTFLDYAGIAAPEDMQGFSLRDVWRGETPDGWRTSMYSVTGCISTCIIMSIRITGCARIATS